MAGDGADARFLRAVAAGVFRLDPDEVAVPRAAFVAVVDGEIIARAPFDRFGDAAFALLAEDREKPVRALADRLDDVCVVPVVARREQPRKHAVADAGRRLQLRRAPRRKADHRRFALAEPRRRHADQVAVFVHGHDVDGRDGGQVAGALDALGAAFQIDRTVRVHLFQQRAQLRARLALHAEGAGDIAARRRALRFLEVGDDLLLGGKAGLLPGFRAVTCAGFGTGSLARLSGRGGGFCAFSQMTSFGAWLPTPWQVAWFAGERERYYRPMVKGLWRLPSTMIS